MAPLNLITILLLTFTISTLVMGQDIVPQNKIDKKEEVSSPSQIENSNGTKVGNGTADRIGLTVHRGHAQAYGPQGQYSASDALNYKYQVGIIRPGYGGGQGQYQSLYDKTGGQANSFSTGLGAPQTWAGGNSYGGRPGHLGGSANSGYRGGHGSANTNSYVQEKKIQLADGSILYSNLHDVTKSDKEPAKPEETQKKDGLVLSA